MSMHSKPVVNILTRTSGRPRFFNECVSSIETQTYENIRHIVCADDEASYRYAKDKTDTVIKAPRKPKLGEYGLMHAPYNLYCNKLMEEVKEGWIMFLDDDDIFLNEDSISSIVENINNDKNFLIWKVKFPQRIIPTWSFGKSMIHLGDISSIGFMFHERHRWAAQWDEVKGSDYRVALKLFLLLKPRWINQVYTAINYDHATNGAGGGLGRRIDKANIND